LRSQQAPVVITVAGTNGKGSTVAACQALLAEFPKVSSSPPRIGVYTSPHLIRFNERIVVNGEPCSDEKICDALEEVESARQAAQTLPSAKDRTSQSITLTYFEFTTLAALFIFARSELDYWLLEIGLGGRLDAVNIIDPDIAVITQIGLDHHDYLGGDRESIGREKAGILRPGIPAVVADLNPPESLRKAVNELGCNCCWASPGDLSGFDLYKLRLHPLSWWAALQVAKLVDIEPDPDTLPALYEHTAVEGRFTERNYYHRQLILDVAHNREAVGYLAERLAGFQARTIAIFSALRDKPVPDMLMQLHDLVDHWYFVSLHEVKRALDADELENCWKLSLESARESGVEISAVSGSKQPGPVEKCRNMKTALNSAVQQSAAGDRIVIFGSFYTVAQALEIIDIDPG